MNKRRAMPGLIRFVSRDPSSIKSELDRARRELERDGCLECGRDITTAVDSRVPAQYLGCEYTDYPWTLWHCKRRRCRMGKDWHDIYDEIMAENAIWDELRNRSLESYRAGLPDWRNCSNAI